MTDQTTSPVAAAQLPLTLISLDDWALVTCQGADAIKYIQGQVTADVENMSASQHVLAAHCDAKGKMWSNLRLFHRGEGLGYLVRRNLVATQLTELKKYAVFSKVTFNQDNNVSLFGVAGAGARAALATQFATLPDAEQQVVQDGESTLLHFAQPAERFLLIVTAEKAQQLQAALAEQAALVNSQQWLALDIEAGIPIIDSENSAQHIPQATNLQALAGGISFKKGCYTGQEMVARAKFRGANKRALYWLAGSATQVPAAGDALEMQLGENWRRTGTILSAIKLADEQLWVQIVMNNDLESDTLFRVREDNDSRLNIQPLPYSLLDEK